MNPVKVAIVAGILLFGLILYAVFVPSPTIAAECTNYDVTVASLEAQGQKPFFIATENLAQTSIDAEAITGDHYGVPTRGFIIDGGSMLVLGLEVGGCLLDPVYIRKPTAKADIGV